MTSKCIESGSLCLLQSKSTLSSLYSTNVYCPVLHVVTYCYGLMDTVILIMWLDWLHDCSDTSGTVLCMVEWVTDLQWFWNASHGHLTGSGLMVLKAGWCRGLGWEWGLRRQGPRGGTWLQDCPCDRLATARLHFWLVISSFCHLTTDGYSVRK